MVHEMFCTDDEAIPWTASTSEWSKISFEWGPIEKQYLFHLGWILRTDMIREADFLKLKYIPLATCTIYLGRDLGNYWLCLISSWLCAIFLFRLRLLAGQNEFLINVIWLTYVENFKSSSNADSPFYITRWTAIDIMYRYW